MADLIKSTGDDVQARRTATEQVGYMRIERLDLIAHGSFCKVTIDLSKRTQVIIFTHHQHQLDLARSNLSDEQFHLHSLCATDEQGNSE